MHTVKVIDAAYSAFTHRRGRLPCSFLVSTESQDERWSHTGDVVLPLESRHRSLQGYQRSLPEVRLLSPCKQRNGPGPTNSVHLMEVAQEVQEMVESAGLMTGLQSLYWNSTNDEAYCRHCMCTVLWSRESTLGRFKLYRRPPEEPPLCGCRPPRPVLCCSF